MKKDFLKKIQNFCSYIDYYNEELKKSGFDIKGLNLNKSNNKMYQQHPQSVDDLNSLKRERDRLKLEKEIQNIRN